MSRNSDILDAQFTDRIQKIRSQIDRLSQEHIPLREATQEAGSLLDQLLERRNELREVNQRLAQVSAETTELLVEVEEKNEQLEKTNQELARANANAAELVVEINDKNEHIETLNSSLSNANAVAAELVAELEAKKEELEVMNQALEQANGDKSQLLGVVAHDLRSGIGGIGSLAELLEDLIPDENAEAFSYVELIQGESNTLLTLLSSLLDMARLDQGRLDLRPEPCDLNEIVEAASFYYIPFADKKNQILNLHLDPEIPSVEIDPVRIRQVCDNLISNAVKYSLTDTMIHIRTEQKKNGVCCLVEDEGPGLSDEDLQNLFISFRPLSAQPTGGEESHGLGLSIARKVINLHHGRIWAENRIGQRGACFQFFVPFRFQKTLATLPEQPA